MLYLTADFFPIFIPLGVVGFYRYLIYLIKILAWGVYRPIRPIENPLYDSKEDVTIVVPTIDAGEEFREAARSWIACKPKEILVVTEESMEGPIRALADSINPELIKVLTVPRANKRDQMVKGIQHTKTDILVFADDDVIWQPTMLEYILACFEDESIGGVGTSQAVKPIGKRQTVWEILAGFRLTVRNIEVAASTHMDGGVCCLSGRTAAYRTVILKDPDFQHSFTNDYWRGRYKLNSGDDKFLTRWMISHGWHTYMQVCPEAQLLSTFKDNWRFLRQVLRWTRNTWRSDLRSLFTERFLWKRHPFVAYTMVDKLFNPLTLLSGPVSVMVLCFLQYHLPQWNIAVSYLGWLLLTRLVKLSPHLVRYPQHIFAVPAFLIFNFYFAFMKVYALFTLNVTGWGTRTAVGATA
ncbi:nucleotide-diphospho-sugar transferase [Syncephalastrum racemosum]|uniref:Nucleotide-diphospho-sugar transferase n=1 Tax=Syncephalastrum racemosum TaxID=13706 RepID=A0A1X2HLV2_SYNRA|nr:nucleotide-diphospho-sugar transferase [Syncephalastrum racemosum]